MTTGTAYCVRGLMTIGRAAPALGVTAGLAAWLDVNVSADPRLSSIASAYGDIQSFSGTLTSAACPAGCPFVFALSTPGGRSWFRPELSFDPDANLIPLAGRMFFEYASPEPPPSPISVFTDTFTLSAVPEPTTFALSAAGGLAVLGVARRRRRTA